MATIHTTGLVKIFSCLPYYFRAEIGQEESQLDLLANYTQVFLVVFFRLVVPRN